MAKEVEKPKVELDPERVTQVFQLNQTMDEMVDVFMGMLSRTLDAVPQNNMKKVFMRKLQSKINQKTIEIEGTIF